MDTQTVFRTSLHGLEKLHEGKVRDIYSAGADALLIVTSDRLSAFDVVLPDPIPGSGQSRIGLARTKQERTSPQQALLTRARTVLALRDTRLKYHSMLAWRR